MTNSETDPSGQPEATSPREPTVRLSLREQREEALQAARSAVAAGRCIVLPTDTVYGIGADALNRQAVQALLDAKQRGRDMPPPVLIAEPAMMAALVRDVPSDASKLAEAFWPGALTIILRAQTALPMDLGETRGTIAVRVPDHELTRALLRATGPLAVSSANTSGLPPATTIDEAHQMLGDTVAVYLDDGPAPGNVPSTIVDFTSTTKGRVLRAGAIGLAELQAVAPHIESATGPASEVGAEAQSGQARTSDETGTSEA